MAGIQDETRAPCQVARAFWTTQENSRRTQFSFRITISHWCKHIKYPLRISKQCFFVYVGSGAWKLKKIVKFKINVWSFYILLTYAFLKESETNFIFPFLVKQKLSDHNTRGHCFLKAKGFMCQSFRSGQSRLAIFARTMDAIATKWPK